MNHYLYESKSLIKIFKAKIILNYILLMLQKVNTILINKRCMYFNLSRKYLHFYQYF